MEKIISKLKIKPVNKSKYEVAWKISDTMDVIEYLFSLNYIILGGDILDSSLEYNYDSWFYEVDKEKHHTENVKNSYEKACNYIKNYIQRNGNDYYVILVIGDSPQG